MWDTVDGNRDHARTPADRLAVESYCRTVRHGVDQGYSEARNPIRVDFDARQRLLVLTQQGIERLAVSELTKSYPKLEGEK
jgi:hypothetical protein